MAHKDPILNYLNKFVPFLTFFLTYFPTNCKSLSCKALLTHREFFHFDFSRTLRMSGDLISSVASRKRKYFISILFRRRS